MWQVVEGAVAFVLRLQQPGGEVLWSLDPTVTPAATPCSRISSIHHSLRCAVAIAERLGFERPEWELAAERIVEAWCTGPGPSPPRSGGPWTGTTRSSPAPCPVSGPRDRIAGRWAEFVLDGVGVRCVSDHDWVTAAETSECAMALDAVGLRDQAALLLDWTRHMRESDGSYWTGCVHPECVRYPGGERTTYTAAAVLLADHSLYGFGPSAGLFRGDTLPGVVDVAGGGRTPPRGLRPRSRYSRASALALLPGQRAGVIPGSRALTASMATPAARRPEAMHAGMPAP